MKKTLSVLLTIILFLFTLTSCNSDTPPKNNDDTLNNTESPTTDTKSPDTTETKSPDTTKTPDTTETKSPDTTKTPDTTDTSLKNENPPSDFKYIENNGIVYIVNYLGTRPDVVIPEKINDVEVTVILQNAFLDNKFIKSVIIPDTVTEIRVSAFDGCESLVSVVLPKNLTKIEACTFANCTNLSNISLPSTLNKLGTRCFEECKSLKNITIPRNIVTWEANTFIRSGLETVNFEEGLEIIGMGAFWDTNLKQIRLPDSLKFIDTNAFGSCRKLEKVELNEGLIIISRGAFINTNLTEIIIPTTVLKVWVHCFEACDALKAIKFEGNAPEEFVTDGLPITITSEFTVYFHKEATGFTSPEWYGYPTQIW